jgi:hypothetical protein
MIINTFQRKVHDVRMPEKMGKKQSFIRTTHVLYSLVDKCALMKEGHMGPEMAAKATAEPISADTGTNKKRKQNQKQAFITDPRNPVEPTKPVIAEVAVVKTAKGPWCTFHASDQHELQDCNSLHFIVESRKHRQVDRMLHNCFVCGEPMHLARACPTRVDGGGRAR